MTTGFEQKRYSGTVIIYNLITDENDPVTAFAVDWIRAFAEISDEVVVFSTHVGTYNAPGNVTVIELGGGTAKKRLFGLLKLYRSAIYVSNIRGRKIVFHHMSEKTAFLVGPILRILGIKQGLWYSHNRKSNVLILASKFVNYIFSPTTNSFPIKSSKIRPVGHGINMSRFQKIGNSTVNRKGIVSLGRISKVKNLEVIIDSLSRVSLPRPSLTLIGPVMEEDKYVEALIKRAKDSDVQLTLEDGISYSQVPKVISQYSMAFSGSPNTVDKSVLEAAAVGCFVLSVNEFVLELSGMGSVWSSIGVKAPLEITSQIELLKHHELDTSLREIIAASSIEKNDVKNTAFKILIFLATNEK